MTVQVQNPSEKIQQQLMREEKPGVDDAAAAAASLGDKNIPAPRSASPAELSTNVVPAAANATAPASSPTDHNHNHQKQHQPQELTAAQRDSANTLIQYFIRFTCSKLGRDPSPLLRSREELAAWIVYQNSREIRDWARYTVSFVRDTNRVLNDELQEQWTDATWKFWNHHTHLPSLFTQDYGGEGFARKRDREPVYCAQCEAGLTRRRRRRKKEGEGEDGEEGEEEEEEEEDEPCPNCYAEGELAEEDWHTGWPGFRDEVTGPKRCCHWDRRDRDNVTVCSMCYEDGYIGQMFYE